MEDYNDLLLLLILCPLSSHGSDYSELFIGYLFTAIQRRERIREKEGGTEVEGGEDPSQIRRRQKRRASSNTIKLPIRAGFWNRGIQLVA